MMLEKLRALYRIKWLRFSLESLFLAIGLYYFFAILWTRIDALSSGDISFRPGVFAVSALMFFATYLTLALGLKRAIALNFPEMPAMNYMQVYGTLSLSNLGKYIPGKIWSFVAFNNLGTKFGLPVKFMSSIFVMNLAMAFLASATLFALRFCPETFAITASILLFLGGGFLVNVFATKLSTSALKGHIPKGMSIYWNVQWLNAWLSGSAYYLLGVSLGVDRPCDFAALTSYPISYMVAYALFVFPAGIGAREGMLSVLDGQYAGSPETIVMSRLMTIAIDGIGACVGLVVFLMRGRSKTSD